METPSKKKLLLEAEKEYNKNKNAIPDKQSFVLGYVLNQYGNLYNTVKGLHLQEQLMFS